MILIRLVVCRECVRVVTLSLLVYTTQNNINSENDTFDKKVAEKKVKNFADKKLVGK